MIEYEVVRCVTLDRGDRHRISLRPGARLRVHPIDDDFNAAQLAKAVREGKLRPVPSAVFR